MERIDFFKQQAKNLLKDYNTRVFDENEGLYVYSPRFFHDIGDIVMNFDIDEKEPLPLMKAQHIISRLAGFYKWTELITASDPLLEIGELLLTNREAYNKEWGRKPSKEVGLNVADWKTYEKEHLRDADDEKKLEVFKGIFLVEGKTKQTKRGKIVLDFSQDIKAQDMLKKIMIKRKLSPSRAILFSITKNNCEAVSTSGWAGIALSLWGHGDPDGIKAKLDSPIIKIKPSNEQMLLLKVVMWHEKVNVQTAILYFMIFALEKLGYHI